MAEEAAVENLPVNFFCHKCNLEISSVLPDFTCPTCQSGFIEALNNAPEPIDESDMDVEGIDAFGLFHDMFLSGGNEDRHGGSRRLRRNYRADRMRRFNSDVPIEMVLQDFVMNLTEVGLGAMGSNSIGVGTGRGTGGAPVLLLGNPGDYAWGREGLDAIVTQLLNQMDTSGPPPLAKEKINEIPTTAITKDQADINLQCSVCWEDFKVDEPVRKLPCEHVYHENCIIPWLELHGTCPICRKTLDDGRSESSDSSRSTNVVGNSLASLFRYASESTSSRTPSSSSSSSSSSTSSSTTSTSGNNTSTSSSRPDFNMDIDYD